MHVRLCVALGAGYLEREDQVVAGKVRKYSTITDLGRDALDEA